MINVVVKNSVAVGLAIGGIVGLVALSVISDKKTKSKLEEAKKDLDISNDKILEQVDEATIMNSNLTNPDKVEAKICLMKYADKVCHASNEKSLRSSYAEFSRIYDTLKSADKSIVNAEFNYIKSINDTIETERERTRLNRELETQHKYQVEIAKAKYGIIGAAANGLTQLVSNKVQSVSDKVQCNEKGE